MTSEKIHEINDFINRKFFKWFLLIGWFIAMFLIFLNGCESEPKPTVQVVDTLTPKINANNIETDTLASKLPTAFNTAQNQHDTVIVYRVKYKTVYDSVYITSDSTERIGLQLLEDYKTKQDSAQDLENQALYYIINNQGKQIVNYKENELYYDLRHTQDSTYTQYLLNDSIPKVKKSEFKRGKKQGRKEGTIVTLLIETLIYGGVQAVKP